MLLKPRRLRALINIIVGNGNSTLLSVIQEDQLDDGWSPVISDYDRVTNPKALREAFSIHKFPTSLINTLFTLFRFEAVYRQTT